MSLLTKWIKENEKDIILKNNGDHYTVDYMGISSKITKPNKSYSYYFVCTNNQTDYIWYDNVNRYCIEKEPSEKNILSKLVRFIEKESKELTKVQNNEQINKIESRENQNDDIQLEYYTLKSKINSIVESGKCTSDLTSECQIKKLYDEKIVANIVANDFLESWKFSKELGFNLELIDDNIFSWRIQISKFSDSSEISKDLKIMDSKFGINYVEFEISFHDKFYPNYPPLIKITKPNLKDSLAHRIANSKMTQLSYWTPTRDTQFIIFRVISILEKFGKIEVCEVKKKTCVHVSNMIGYLSKFSCLIDLIKEDDEIDRDSQFKKYDIIRADKQTNTNHINKPINTGGKGMYWKGGTGYGTTGSKEWNPEEYVKLQKEKDKHISILITKIVNELQSIDNTSEDFFNVCKVISNSLLLPYLKQQFKQCTLLEMQSREQLFRLLTNLLESLASENSIYLFDIKSDNENLYDVLKNNWVIIKGATKMDSENEFLQMLSGTLEIIVFPMYEEFSKKKEKNQKVKEIPKKEENIDKSIKEIYKEKLTSLRFEYSNILDTNFKKEYVNLYNSEKNSNWRNCQKRLSIELSSLIPEGQLPIDYEASVFLRVDENYPMIIRSLITGPHDTPYENGLFIFDLYPTSEYPKTFKNCWFMNTGGKRFNPNLYNEGKVCLSILGTWGGRGAENWNEKTSSLLQVLISIQSQILIPEPYFNEPGHEINIGKDYGIKQSKSYNNDIRYFTMCHAIRDFLVNPKIYPQFENVVRLHFKLKKERILETCQKWTDEAFDSSYARKTDYTNVFNDIKERLKSF